MFFNLKKANTGLTLTLPGYSVKTFQVLISAVSKFNNKKEYLHYTFANA